MPTKKKSVKKSAPKKKAAPRGKRLVPVQSLTIRVVGDVKDNPFVNVEIKGDNTTLVAGLSACYFKDARMKDIIGTTFMTIAEIEKKNLLKEVIKPVSKKATPKKKK